MERILQIQVTIYVKMISGITRWEKAVIKTFEVNIFYTRKVHIILAMHTVLCHRAIIVLTVSLTLAASGPQNVKGKF